MPEKIQDWDSDVDVRSHEEEVRENVMDSLCHVEGPL